MKQMTLLLAAGALLCAVAQAQVVASPKGRHGIASGPSATHVVGPRDKTRRVKHMVPPPASMRATGAARMSTAQARLARQNHPPLDALPAYDVTALTGQSVAVGTLKHVGHWLMLYVAPHCIPCEGTLTSLAASERPSLQGGQPLVIVVRAHNTNEVTELRSKYPSLANAAWVMDPKGDGIRAMKLGAMPTLYGLSEGSVAFTLPGTMGDPAKVEKMAGSWMTSTSHVQLPAAAATASATPATTPTTTK